MTRDAFDGSDLDLDDARGALESIRSDLDNAESCETRDECVANLRAARDNVATLARAIKAALDEVSE